MKKLKVILGTIAFIGAIGGTFATQYNDSVTIQAYRFIDGSPDTCLKVEDHNCVTAGDKPCEMGSDILRESRNALTQCGNELRRP